MAKSTLFPDLESPVRFFIDMAPVAQPRQRHAYSKGLGRIINYIPKDHPIHTFKQLARIRAQAAYNGPKLVGPLEAYLLFLIARPEAMKKPPGRVWCDAHVGDIDNFEKAVLDALNPIRGQPDSWGAYKDDCQVCQVTKRKFYAAISEQPGVEVMIQELR